MNEANKQKAKSKASSSVVRVEENETRTASETSVLSQESH
jgi:hypothetical protein